MIIGIAGKKGVGKTTAAKFIQSVHTHFEHYNFADPLKYIVGYLTGWSDEHLYGNLKDTVDPYWGFSPREALQKIGTEGFRKLLHDDFWIKVAETTLIDNVHYIISDIRFENEAEFVRNKNGIIIHILREIEREHDSHESEKGLEIKPKDFVIENDSSIEFLYDQILILLRMFNRNKNA